MQTWAIIAQKGGQSKTTIATAFAVEAAREGAAVVILDADDRQGSALYWSERRDSDDGMVKDRSVAGLPLHVSRGRDTGTVDPNRSEEGGAGHGGDSTFRYRGRTEHFK